MGEIKSAAEIAREKLENLGAVTDEERLKWKYVPEGEKLAARYIKEDYNLLTELNKYEKEARKYVSLGASDIFVRNINLPRNEASRKMNKKVMEGLKAIKNDKVAVENVFTKMRRILDHYVQQGEQQKKQAFESLKVEFAAKVQQAIKQQTGIDTKMKIDVERQPQFQQEWLKVQAQLDSQYIKLLDEYRHELAAIT
ncbi:MAG: hypothetical protein A2144_05720 [Chloroflexi bacterium RBG_16_50_9]|nr:MAG: hypothetical protein A2144_05720 [Chloroflexi bacterium RBG_16_50_9]